MGSAGYDLSDERQHAPGDLDGACDAQGSRVTALPKAERSVQLRLPSSSTPILADVWLTILSGSGSDKQINHDYRARPERTYVGELINDFAGRFGNVTHCRANSAGG